MRCKFVWFIIIFTIFSSGCARQPASVETTDEKRIVSLAPSLTEIIWAIGAGDMLVGRTSACDYPVELVKHVPVIGGFGKPSIDSLIMVNPTIVLTVDLEDKRIEKFLEQIGIRTERVKCSNLNDIASAILKVGNYAGRQESAQKLASRINKKLDELRSEISEGPSVYVEIWSDPLMTVGRESFISELISLAGGRNIGDEITDREYFSVSPEWIISKDPEIIICLYMSDAGTIAETVGKRIGWRNIQAVQNQRVYGGLENSLILRPGPRVLEGIEILRKRIKGNGDE